MSKPIFIKNKRRALREALGSTEKWIPEHERLNMSPITAVDASEDFMNEKRKKNPFGARKQPATPVLGSGRTRAVAPANVDQAWLPPEGPMQRPGRPPQVPERDFAQGDVGYEEVPSPPETPFEHPHRALGVDLSGVQPGQYCLIYANEAWPSDSLEAIEEAVEQIMRNDPNVQDDELIIIKRLGIKVGVSIDD